MRQYSNRKPRPRLLLQVRQKPVNKKPFFPSFRELFAAISLLLFTICPLMSCKTNERKKEPVSCSKESKKRITSISIQAGLHQTERPVRFENSELKAIIESIVSKSGEFVLDLKNKETCGEPHELHVDLDFRQLIYKDKGRASVIVAITLQSTVSKNDQESGISRGEGLKTYDVSTTPDVKALYTDLLKRSIKDVFRFIEIEEKLKDAPHMVVSSAMETGVVQLGGNGEEFSLRPSSWQKVASSTSRATIPMLGVVASSAGKLASSQMPAPLEKGSDDIQEMAIKTAASRKLRECLPSLLYIIRYGARQRLRDQALAAIIEIGDRSVVPKLTEMAKFQDSDGIRQIMEVLSQLGGPEARAFLELTADGHPDREVRRMARSSLKKLSP